MVVHIRLVKVTSSSSRSGSEQLQWLWMESVDNPEDQSDGWWMDDECCLEIRLKRM